MIASPASPIRILLIEDHAIMRTGLRLLMARDPQMIVVGEAVEHDDAVALAASMNPDIILLDIYLGDSNGVDYIPDLLAVAPCARVLLLTGAQDIQEHYRALRLGAMGLVMKQQAAEVLLKAIAKVHQGEVWLDRTRVACLLGTISHGQDPQRSDPHATQIALLTQRERTIIALICEAFQNKQIAQHLHISETTVSHHLTSIFDRLGVATRLELVIYAYRHGLAAPERPQSISSV